MKRHIILFALSLVLCGCSSEQLGELQGRLTQKYFASFDNQSTKVFVDDQIHLRWNENDCISIFNSTYNAEYKFDGNTGDDNGTFSPINDSYNTGNDIPSTYAIYPYMQTTSISTDGVITYVFPRVQAYAENTFGLGANAMVAVTESRTSKSLHFKNLCGYIVIQLYGEGSVKQITVKGNNDERISGSSSISASFDSNPTISMIGNEPDANSRIVTLDCGEGVTLGSSAEASTAFWVCLPPTVFSKGLTITITDTEGRSMVKTISNSKELKRNVINHITPIQTSFESHDIEISCADFNNLESEDANTYLLKGQVSGNIELAFGYFDIKDNTGSSYIYGCTNWNEYSDKINGGDIVSVRGKFFNYNGKKEMMDAYIVSWEPNEPQRPNTIIDIQLSNFLNRDDNPYTWYRISGLKCINANISAYGRVLFTDGYDTIELFAPDNFNKFDFSKKDVVYDIVGHKSTYKGVVQMSGGYVESQYNGTRKLYLTLSSGSTKSASISDTSLDFDSGDLIFVNGLSYDINKDSQGYFVQVPSSKEYFFFYPGRSFQDMSYSTGLYFGIVIPYCVDDYYTFEPHLYGYLQDTCKDYDYVELKLAGALLELSFKNQSDEMVCSLEFTNPVNGYWYLLVDQNGVILNSSCTDSKSSNSVTFSLSADRPIYTVSMPPFFSSNGFKLYIYDNNGKLIDSKDFNGQLNFQNGVRYKFSNIEIENQTYSAVDLGLSVKWADKNIGASKAENSGDYYAWGEIEPYYSVGYAQSTNPRWKDSKSSGYDWPSYRWYDSSSRHITKYCIYTPDPYYDNKPILESEDDVASVLLGSEWHIPTIEEWDELSNPDNCTWTLTNINGVNGYLISSKIQGYINNSIFLPICSSRWDKRIETGTGLYWSSSVGNYGSNQVALGKSIQSGPSYNNYCSYDRCYGFNIRPVKK